MVESSDTTTLPMHLSPYFLVDLNETASRYDRIVASASPESLNIMWMGWGLIATCVSVFSALVLMAILVTPNVRKSPFNAYIIYLIIPDIIFSLFCAMACFVNLHVGHIASTALCRFQSFFMIFGIGANSWINLVVALEVHKVLRQSHQCVRYEPPRRRTVTMQACTVYVAVTLFACLEYLPGNVVPMQSRPHNGAVCLPVEYNSQSSWFYYLFFLPLLAFLPLLGVIGVAVHVWYTGMLPTTGKSRHLALYFGRVFVCFAFMWLPGVLLFFVTGGKASPWVTWAGGAWSHLQGVVSAGLALLKPDIAAAFYDLMHCRLTVGLPDDWASIPMILSRRRSMSLNTITTSSCSVVSQDFLIPITRLAPASNKTLVTASAGAMSTNHKANCQTYRKKTKEVNSIQPSSDSGIKVSESIASSATI